MKIEIGEHCFGPILCIDGTSIFRYVESTQDDYELNEKVFQIIIDKLNSIKDKLSRTWTQSLMSVLQGRSSKFNISDDEYEALDDEDTETRVMCEKINYNTSLIIEEIVNSKNEFDGRDFSTMVELYLNYMDAKISKEESKRSSCDQCGNYNFVNVYYI